MADPPVTAAAPGAPAPDAAEDRALLVAAAEAGGALALEHFRRPVRAWDKAGGQGPVSDADLAVNRLLAERLRDLRPGYGWLSEEDPDDASRLGAERIFVVDPIDGTRAFLAQEPGFAVALAVVERGRVIAGAVCLPARGETYSAHLGGGAVLTRDGAPQTLAVSVRDSPAGARVLANRSQLGPEHWPGGVPRLERAHRPSLAWRLCLVAAGRYDATLTFRPAWEWDVAAGALIVEEAGGRVTDGDGRPLAFNTESARAPGLLVAPRGLHARLSALRAR